MTEIKIPENLGDTFADTKLYEHPVEVEHVDTSRYESSKLWRKEIEFPEGWELIATGTTTKLVKVRDSRDRWEPTLKEITVPVYLLGRRRDDYVRDLRGRLQSAIKLQREATRKMEEAFSARDIAVANSKDYLKDIEKWEQSDAKMAEALRAAEKRYQKLERQCAKQDKEIKRLERKIIAQ